MENTNNVDAISLNTSGLINAEPNEPLLYTVFKQYEGVIIESLISSFGLNFIMHDQHGGNVDTVHNVNQIGKDPLMTYKNKQNELDYQNRGEYDSDTVHKNKEFANVKHEAREKFQETGIPIVDEYTGGNLYFYGKGKGDNAAKSAELDHIVSGKAVNDDRGRVLAGNSTEELANIKVNFAFTNKSLNCSMGADEIPDYIAKHPELPEEQKQAMLKKYNKAKAEIDRRNRIKYCTSSQFRKDLARSAGKSALKCGAKQALGLVFAEIWFCIKDVMFKSKDELDDDKGMSSFITKIGNAIKKGIENAKAKYKEIISKFFTGGLSGALSDITTTLCNIFFTTGKNLIKIIRQSYISVVEAGKILIFNPDNLLFGEKVLAAVKILSTGASIVVGGLVTDAIGKLKEISFGAGILTAYYKTCLRELAVAGALTSVGLEASAKVAIDVTRTGERPLDTILKIQNGNFKTQASFNIGGVNSIGLSLILGNTKLDNNLIPYLENLSETASKYCKALNCTTILFSVCFKVLKKIINNTTDNWQLFSQSAKTLYNNVCRLVSLILRMYCTGIIVHSDDANTSGIYSNELNELCKESEFLVNYSTECLFL